MYCENCGTKNQDNAIFCNECGGKIKEDNVSQQGIGQQQPSNVALQRGYKRNNGVTVVAIIAFFLAVALSFCLGIFVGRASANYEIKAVQTEVSQGAPVAEESKVFVMVEPTKEVTQEPAKEPTKEPTKEPDKEQIKEQDQKPKQQEEVAKDISEIGMEMGIAPSDPSNGEPVEVLKIREWFQDTENNARQSSKSGGVTCYRKNGELVKIKVDAGYVLGVYDEFLTKNRREYFYKDNQLYFAHIVTSNPAGDRFYYVGGNVLRYSEPDDVKHYYNEQISPYMALGYSCKTEGESLFWQNVAG